MASDVSSPLRLRPTLPPPPPSWPWPSTCTLSNRIDGGCERARARQLPRRARSPTPRDRPFSLVCSRRPSPVVVVVVVVVVNDVDACCSARARARRWGRCRGWSSCVPFLWLHFISGGIRFACVRLFLDDNRSAPDMKSSRSADIFRSCRKTMNSPPGASGINARRSLAGPASTWH